MKRKTFSGVDKLLFVRFPEEVGKELQRRAKERWMTLSDYIRQLVRKALKAEKMEEHRREEK